jgi:hypothetical protein
VPRLGDDFGVFRRNSARLQYFAAILVSDWLNVEKIMVIKNFAL